MSWTRVSRLFTRTIRSACSQTSPEFRVIAVCSDIPDGDWSHPGLEIISADHLPEPGADLTRRRIDKQRKRLIGLERAAELSTEFVMFLDSDDCVSNRLAGYVAKHRDANGWYFGSGYFYSERQKRLHLEYWRYAQWCGSGHIVRPEHLDYLDTSEGYIRVFHTRMTREFRERGTPLKPLPFHGGVYCVSHGDNFNDYEPILWPSNPFLHALRRVAFHRALTPAIEDEFGLYPVCEDS